MFSQNPNKISENYQVKRLTIGWGIGTTLSVMIIIWIFSELKDGPFESVGNLLGYKGLSLLLLSLMVLMIIMASYYRSWINIYKNKSDKKEQLTESELLNNYKNLLETLASDEKRVLKKFIDNDVSIQYFNDFENGLGESLRKKQILFQATNATQAPDYKFGYSIEPIVRKCLLQYPELLD